MDEVDGFHAKRLLIGVIRVIGGFNSGFRSVRLLASAKFAELFFGDAGLLEYLAVETAADFSAGMDWNGGGTSIGMLPAAVAAFLPGLDEAEFSGGPHQFPGLSRHGRW